MSKSDGSASRRAGIIAAGVLVAACVAGLGACDCGKEKENIAPEGAGVPVQVPGAGVGKIVDAKGKTVATFPQACNDGLTVTFVDAKADIPRYVVVCPGSFVTWNHLTAAGAPGEEFVVQFTSGSDPFSIPGDRLTSTNGLAASGRANAVSSSAGYGVFTYTVGPAPGGTGSTAQNVHIIVLGN